MSIFLIIIIIIISQMYTHWKSGIKKYSNKKHDSYISLQNHTSAKLHKNITYNYNNMKQIVERE